MFAVIVAWWAPSNCSPSLSRCLQVSFCYPRSTELWQREGKENLKCRLLVEALRQTAHGSTAVWGGRRKLHSMPTTCWTWDLSMIHWTLGRYSCPTAIRGPQKQRRDESPPLSEALICIISSVLPTTLLSSSFPQKGSSSTQR